MALAISAVLCAAAPVDARDPGSPPGTVSWRTFAQLTSMPEEPPNRLEPVLAAPPIPTTVSALRLSDIAGRSRVRIDPTLPAMRGQPVLEEADVRASVERALGNSYDLAGARARSTAQRFQIDVATGALRPRVDLRTGAGLENSRPSARTDPVTGTALSSSNHGREDTTLVMRQPLYDLGARSERERQQALFGSTEANVAVTRDQVTVDAGTAHLDVLQYSLAAEFALEYRAELEKLFSLVNARVEAGGASPAESERVKARAISARSSVIEAGGSLESALLTYRRLVGAVPGAMPADDVLASAALPSLEEALERAKQQNPTLASLRESQRALEAEVASARARMSPRVELEVGNYRTRGASGAATATNEARAMFVLSWNLANGGADVAAQNVAVARLEDNRYRILDGERRIDESLRISYNTLNAVERRAQSVRDEFVANQRVVDAFRTQLTSGNRPLLDVLDAEQRLFQSRVELLRLTVLQASLTLQALRQIGLIGGAVATGEVSPPAPTPSEAPRGVTSPAPTAPTSDAPRTAPDDLPSAPLPPAVLPPAPTPPAAPPPRSATSQRAAPPAPATPAPLPASAVPAAPASPAPVPPAVLPVVEPASPARTAPLDASQPVPTAPPAATPTPPPPAAPIDARPDATPEPAPATAQPEPGPATAQPEPAPAPETAQPEPAPGAAAHPARSASTNTDSAGVMPARRASPASTPGA